MKSTIPCFRPVRETDLPALTDLVGRIADGLTTLPNDPKFLENKVHHCLRSLYPKINKPGDEYYLFVLEASPGGPIVGTSGLLARVGGFEPFYTYEIQTERQVYEPLGIDNPVDVLHLKRSHKGPSELCSLFLHPDYRRTGWGRTLSLARLLFVRAFPERFDREMIAELRGYINPAGKSPFWEAVGEPFFRKDYYTADILTGLGEKAFIEALMPRHPIYVSLLPPAARSVIGHVHRDTEAARQLLLREGFEGTREVDIFDAGPLIKGEVKRLRTVREAVRTVVEIVDRQPSGERPNAILAKPLLDFRAIPAHVPAAGAPSGGNPAPLQISPEEAEVLQVQPNDPIDYVLTRPA
jgi:arginine N-succinyltransferase